MPLVSKLPFLTVVPCIFLPGPDKVVRLCLLWPKLALQRVVIEFSNNCHSTIRNEGFFYTSLEAGDSTSRPFRGEGPG